MSCRAARPARCIAARCWRPRMRNRRRNSTKARTSSSISATASAAPTISMPACWRATSASTFPGNPTIVPKNMEGAGSLRLANWLYNVGAKDGTVIRHHRPRHRIRSAARLASGAQFQADKFTWIGSANNEVSVCVAWKTSGITKFEDMFEQGADRRRHRARPPIPISFRASSTACSAPSSRSSPAIPAATTSRWRWSGARCRAAAAGRGRACSPPISAGSTTDRSRPGAAVARQASRSARCSPGHGFRQDRRAEADLQADLRAAGDGPAVSCAPARAEGPRECAAQRVHATPCRTRNSWRDAEKAQLEITSGERRARSRSW